MGAELRGSFTHSTPHEKWRWGPSPEYSRDLDCTDGDLKEWVFRIIAYGWIWFSVCTWK